MSWIDDRGPLTTRTLATDVYDGEPSREQLKRARHSLRSLLRDGRLTAAADDTSRACRGWPQIIYGSARG